MTERPQQLDRDAVQALLPHRDPMLFCDRVLSWSDGAIHTQLNIRPDLPCFEGHFPGKPVFPGVLQIEAVAQAGALLGALTLDLGSDAFLAFSGVSKAKFARPVLPGDVLDIHLTMEKTRLPFVWFAGEARVGDARAATVLFSAARMAYDAL